MTLTCTGLDLDSVKMKQQAKYLGRRLHSWKIIVGKDAHGGPVVLPGPPAWPVNRRRARAWVAGHEDDVNDRWCRWRGGRSRLVGGYTLDWRALAAADFWRSGRGVVVAVVTPFDASLPAGRPHVRRRRTRNIRSVAVPPVSVCARVSVEKRWACLALPEVDGGVRAEHVITIKSPMRQRCRCVERKCPPPRPSLPLIFILTLTFLHSLRSVFPYLPWRPPQWGRRLRQLRPRPRRPPSGRVTLRAWRSAVRPTRRRLRTQQQQQQQPHH